MNNGIAIFLVILTSLFVSKYMKAQQPIKTPQPIIAQNHECGTVFSQKDISYIRGLWQTNKTTESDLIKNTNKFNKSPIYIPIKAHIIRTNSGTGGLDLISLNNAIATMNAYYINANMQFYLCGDINYINNSTYYNIKLNSEGPLFRQYNVSNNINIYLVNSVDSRGSTICGYTRPPGPDLNQNAIVMNNICVTNKATLSHEMGHFYTLRHTHGKSNNGTTDELVDGTNCSTHGDDICDTPADPNLLGVIDPSCVYTGTAVDTNGQTYRPDPKNIMSYAPFGCRTLFSPEQYARINHAAINSSYRNNYSCLSVKEDAGIINILTPKDNIPFCDNNLTPKVIIRNFSSTPLTSVQINYQINNGLINSYSWAGNLKQQQSDTLILPNIAVPTHPKFTFKAFTSNPNTTIDSDNKNDTLISTAKTIDVSTFGSSNTLIANANPISSTYRWLDCSNNYAVIPGETGRVYSSSFSRSYAVEVTENGCTDTSSCTKITLVNIRENALKDQVYIYPNPNKGFVNIKLGTLSNVSIKVLNVNGQIVHFQEGIESKIYQFELNEAGGVYFIEITTKNEKQAFKLLVYKP